MAKPSLSPLASCSSSLILILSSVFVCKLRINTSVNPLVSLSTRSNADEVKTRKSPLLLRIAFVPLFACVALSEEKDWLVNSGKVLCSSVKPNGLKCCWVSGLLDLLPKGLDTLRYWKGRVWPLPNSPWRPIVNPISLKSVPEPDKL